MTAQESLSRSSLSPKTTAQTAKSGGTHGPKRRDIQGLRAIAVLLVVLYHAGVPGIRGGYVGVDVFFVVSGFIITELLLKEAERTGFVSLKTFYARRARRILPAATLVLVATTWGTYHYLGFIKGNRTGTDAKWATGFLANIHFARIGTDYLGAQQSPSPLQHFWSLAVEEQFYVFWPSVIIVACLVARHVDLRVKLTFVLSALTVGSYAWCIHQTTSNGTWAYFSPFTRACELSLGALVAVLMPQLRQLPPRLAALMTWGGLVAMITSAFLLNESTAFPGAIVAWPTAATAVALAGGVAGARYGAEAIIGLPPFQWVGNISYSLYLWHWPLLTIAAERQGHALRLSTALGWVLIAVVLSAATYFLLENPLRYSQLLSRSALASLALGIAFLAASSGVAQGLINAHTVNHHTSVVLAGPATTTGTTGSIDVPAPSTTEAVEALVKSSTSIKSVPADLVPDLADVSDDSGTDLAAKSGCNPGVSTPTVPDCAYGDLSSNKTIVLLGDSHAGMWLAGFDALGKATGYKIVLLMRSACPAVDLSFWYIPEKRPYTQCDAWHAYTIKRINDLHPAGVVLTSYWNGNTDQNHKPISLQTWQAGLKRTLNSFTTPDIKKVVLGDIPYLPEAGPDCLAAHTSEVQACTSTRSAAVLSDHEQVLATAARDTGAKYVPTTPWFCTEKCSPIIGNHEVYLDAAHITASYGRYLSGALAEAIAPVLPRALPATVDGTTALAGSATAQQVAALVGAAASLKELPADLRPSLEDATKDSGQETAGNVGCNPDQNVTTTPDCYFGDVQGSHTLVLFGDSHAVMWMPAFDLIGKRLHWRIALLGKFACSAPDIAYWDGDDKRPNTECATWKTYAMSRLNALKPDVVVLSSEFDTPYDASDNPISPATWKAGLEKTLGEIASPGTKKVVLGDIPYLDQTAAECLAAHTSSIQVCSTLASKAIRLTHVVSEKDAAIAAGAVYLPTNQWFCSTTCTAVIGSYAPYSDRLHITQTYADYLSGALQQALAAVMA